MSAHSNPPRRSRSARTAYAILAAASVSACGALVGVSDITFTSTSSSSSSSHSTSSHSSSTSSHTTSSSEKSDDTSTSEASGDDTSEASGDDTSEASGDDTSEESSDDTSEESSDDTSEKSDDTSQGDDSSSSSGDDTSSSFNAAAGDEGTECKPPDGGLPCTPGKLSCGSDSDCAVGLNVCCGGMCQNAGLPCSNTSVACNEAADCKTGEICCIAAAGTTPSSVRVTCQQGPKCPAASILSTQICRSSAECPGGSCSFWSCSGNIVQSCTNPSTTSGLCTKE